MAVKPLRIEIFLIRKRIVLQYILERSDSCILGSKYAVRIFEWACMTNRNIEQMNKYVTIHCELEILLHFLIATFRQIIRTTTYYNLNGPDIFE